MPLTDTPTVNGGINRPLNTPFKPSLTAPSLVTYTFDLSVDKALLVEQYATVRLMVGADSDSDAKLGEAFLSTVQTGGLTLVPETLRSRQQLTAWVQPNQQVTLETEGSGTVEFVDGGGNEIIFQ